MINKYIVKKVPQREYDGAVRTHMNATVEENNRLMTNARNAPLIPVI